MSPDRHGRRAGLLLLLLACAAPASAQAIDCDAPDSDAERSICRAPALRALDAELAALEPELALRSGDADAVAAEQDAWRRERRDPCTTPRCLETAYRSRIDELARRIAGIRPPLVRPGRYRRPDAGEGSPYLEVAPLGAQRYGLHVLADEDTLLEGGFEERVGSARFESAGGGCTFDLRFAPGLLSLRGAGEGCPAGLDGDYLHGGDAGASAGDAP